MALVLRRSISEAMASANQLEDVTALSARYPAMGHIPGPSAAPMGTCWRSSLQIAERPERLPLALRGRAEQGRGGRMLGQGLVEKLPQVRDGLRLLLG
jgi:hypothetical protein